MPSSAHDTPLPTPVKNKRKFGSTYSIFEGGRQSNYVYGKCGGIVPSITNSKFSISNTGSYMNIVILAVNDIDMR